MSDITTDTTREQLAAIVVAKLKEHSIDAVLVGGSVVSIYTDNKYASNDLDFISPATDKRIEKAMSELRFTRSGKDFVHADSIFTVEFPTGPIGIGDDQPVKPEGRMEVDGVTIVMLSPTQSVMDRLAWFFYSNDRQCLDQALWIAEKHPVSIEQITAWAQRERQHEKLKVFLNRLKQSS
jgi:hypothetical protein